MLVPQPEAHAALRPPLPANAEPTFDDIRNMTTIDMAIARYRAKHGHMNEIFDPRSVARIGEQTVCPASYQTQESDRWALILSEASSKSIVKPVDLATLEAQAVSDQSFLGQHSAQNLT